MKRKSRYSGINHTIWRILFVVGFVGIPGIASAQTFDSGSDGSFGPLNITSNTTIALPLNGILNCTTVMVESGVTLSFQHNELNTPVYLLATGDVVIAGKIDVSGQTPIGTVAGGLGGPGGFDGGPAGSVNTAGGAGRGPGGGKPGPSSVNDRDGAGSGAYGTRGTTTLNDFDGETYGTSLIIPMVGGSGGGGADNSSFYGGGGGGGAILVASDTRILVNSQGRIVADGGPSSSSGNFRQNSGSGGAIRLIAPRVFGTGLLGTRGVGISCSGCGGSGAGRIRIDSLFTFEPGDPSAGSIGFNFQPPGSATIGSTMVVFPPNNPHLDIIEAAGTSIPDGTTSSVLVELPLGASTNQTVVVQASNFSNNVPIRVVLTPTSGNPITVDATIDNVAMNPAEVTVDVTVPVNQPVHINAWTR